MIKLGKVKGNKMIDMQLSNNKLVSRAEKMVMEELNIKLEKAKGLIKKHGSVRKAIESYKILSLKYPEKSSFFADQIKKIKNKK